MKPHLNCSLRRRTSLKTIKSLFREDSLTAARARAYPTPEFASTNVTNQMTGDDYTSLWEYRTGRLI